MGETGRVWLRRIRRGLKVVIIGTMGLIVGLYAVMLVAELCSVRQARQILSRVEALRVGDPAEVAEEALRDCRLQRFENGFGCRILAGPFRWQALWWPVFRILGNESLSFERDLGFVGLHPWLMSVNVNFQNGKIEELSVDVDLLSRYERLGALSVRQSELLPQRFYTQWLSEAERRTNIRLWALTPGGKELVVIVGPGSSEKEVRAGKISPACISAFHGCSNLCELLPGAAPVLEERGGKSGGCPW